MPSWRRITAVGLTIPILAAGGLLANHHLQQLRVDRQWDEHQPRPIDDLGSTDILRITPLVDWYAEDDDLLTDADVAYLVETDHKTILFDLGNNTDQLDPAPLTHNMAHLRHRRRPPLPLSDGSDEYSGHQPSAPLRLRQGPALANRP